MVAEKEEQLQELIQQSNLLDYRNKILVSKSQLLEEQNTALEELLSKVKLIDNEVNFRG